MRRGWKWARRILLGALAATAAGLAAWVAVVPGLVRGIATGELRRMGLGNVALEVRGLSLRHVQMANVAAGEGERLRVGAVGVGFTIGGLLNGRLSVIELTGLEAEVRLRDGQLDLGPLADLGGGEGEGADENPFLQVQLRSSAVLLDLGGRRLRISLQGTATDAGGGRLMLELHLEAEGCTVSLAGTADARGDELGLEWTAQVSEVAALLAALPPQWGKPPLDISGPASLEGSFFHRGRRQVLRGVLDAPKLRLAGELGGTRFAVDSLALHAEGTWPGTRDSEGLPAVSCRLRAKGVAVDGLPRVEELRLAASLDGGTLEMPGAAAEGCGWRFALGRCKATGIGEVLAGSPRPVELDVLSWGLSCDPRQLVASVPQLGEAVETEASRTRRGAWPERSRGHALPTSLITAEGVARVRLAPATREGRTAWAWEVAAPELEAAWEPATLRLPGAGVGLQGVRTRLRLAAEAKDGEVKARLLPGSTISAEAASAELGGLALAFADSEPPALSIRVGEQKAEFAGAMRGGAFDWSLRVPELLLALHRGRAEGPMGLAADGVAAEAKLAVEAGPEQGKFTLAPGFSLTAGSAKLGAEAEAAELSLSTGAEAAVALLLWGGAAGGWSVQAPALGLVVGRARAALPGGVAAEGISLRVRLAAKASARELVATVAGGSNLAIGSLTLPGLGIRKAADGPLLGIALGEKGLEARLPLGGERPAWSLEIPELLIKQSEADLVLPQGLGKIEGCRGDFTFSATAGPEKLSVGFHKPLGVCVKSASLLAGDETLCIGPVELAVASRHEGEGVSVAFDAGLPVRVQGSPQVAITQPLSISFGPGVAATARNTQGSVDAIWSPTEGYHLRVSVAAWLEALVERKLGEEVLEAHLPEASLDAGLVLDSRSGTAVGLSLRTTPEAKPTTAWIAGADVAAGKIDARAKMTWAGGEPVVEARVALDKAAVRHKEAGLALAGLAADVPVSWNAAEPAAGEFAIERLEAGGIKVENIAGTLAVADMRAELTAACEPLKGARVSVDGSLDASRGALRGMVRLSLPLFELKDERALAALVPQLAGLHATGTLGVEGYVRLAGGQVRPSLTLTIHDAELKSEKWDMEAGGVFATVRLSSLVPPLTPRKELQIALVRRAKLGELEVEHGTVAFRLEPAASSHSPLSPSGEGAGADGWAAVVQRADWGWAGGRLYVEDCRFDPEAQEHAFTLHAADLKLEALAALVPDGQLSGVGTLSGMLPVRIAGWPDIRFGNGHLHSLPHQRGWLRIKDLGPIESTIAAVAEASIPDFLPPHTRAEGREQLRESLLTALREFEYDELKLDFIDRGEETLVRFTTRGRGRNPDRWGLRYPIGGIEVNLIGLDSELLKHILKLRVTD